MTKIFIKIALSALLLAVTAAGFVSCVKNRFKVSFQLSPEVNNTYTMAYYASDKTKGWFVETAISLQKGKGEQELPTRNPSLLLIYNGSERIAAYAERGDNIKITGKGTSPYSWNVSGNDINEKWSSWRNRHAKILSAGNAIEINKAVAEFVEQNPDNPLSTLMLLSDYDRRSDPDGFKKLWSSLGHKALAEKWTELLSRNDLISGSPLFRNKPSRLILHSIDNGADTILIGKTPTFLYFWRNGDPGREAMIDSLKALRRTHPDSTKFIIADICFDYDSVSWASPLGRDSLRHTIRAWNPLGEADSVMRVMGVERTPFVVTFNIP